MKKSTTTRKQIGIESLLVLLLILFAGIFLSLITYDSADPGWSQTAWHEPIRNFGGYVGAYISDILLQFFGFIAFTIPVLAIFVILQLMLYFAKPHKSINYFELSFWIIGFLAFIFSATALFSLNIIDLESYKAGGNLGDIVVDSILPIMSGPLLSMILLVICLSCFTLLTGISWFDLLERLGALVMLLISPLLWLAKRYLNRRADRNLERYSDDKARNDTACHEAAAVAESTADESPFNQQDSSNLDPLKTEIQTEFEQNRDDQPVTIVDTQQRDEATQFSYSEPTIKSPDELLQSINIKEDSAFTDSASIDDEVLHNFSLNSSSRYSSSRYSPTQLNELEAHLADQHYFVDINQPIETSVIGTSVIETSATETLATPSLPAISARLDLIEPTIATTALSTTTLPTTPLTVTDPVDSKVCDDLKQRDELDRLDDSCTSFDDYESSHDQIDDQNSDYSHDSNSDHSYDHNYVHNNNHNYNHNNDTTYSTQNSNEDSTVLPNEPHLSSAQESTLCNSIEVTPTQYDTSLIHPLLRRDDQQLTKPTTPLPSLDLLTMPPSQQIAVDHAALNKMAERIEKSLADYRIKAKVVDYLRGPVITRFELELAPGIKAARISTLDRDLARSLAISSVRVVEVIPGKPYVGLELPNVNRQTVYFREVLDSAQFKEATSPLTVVLGKDIAGQAVVADLAKMPHLLVAGTTGSGKSVGVNAMILSILYKSKPDDVRFIMIDPKMLELSIYEGIPHLLTPVVTDMKDAANALNWCVGEMERRYRIMSALGVRNIAGYNEKIKQAEEMGRPIPDLLWKPTDSMDLNMPMLEKMPYIVVMVDEFADLIMAVGKKVEELIARLAQKARAAGIHLVLATQRPSVDVITGLIKANIPTRIAFTVSSKIDSRTILDQMGAESLLGMGDMLYLAPNSSIPVRVHGAFVRDEEVHAVVQDWKARGTPNYIDNVTVGTGESEGGRDNSIDDDLDPLFDQVVDFVIDTRRASISSVQRKFRIGYNRAARIVEQMEIEGVISAPSHNGNREVLAQPSGGDF